MEKAQPTIAQKVQDFYHTLERHYIASGIRLSFRDFLLVIMISAILATLMVGVLAEVFPAVEKSTVILSIVTFFAVLSLGIVIPLHMRDARIQKIEEQLPNALKHLSVVLRAGGTVESAVEEVAKSDYGPLSEDLAKALVQLRRGRTFEDVLAAAAAESGSTLFKRCAIIINDAKRSGAGLAEVMNAIADDARDVNRVRRERVTRTIMHVIFVYAATLLLSPFIFGFTLTVVSFIGAGITCAVPGSSALDLSFLNTILLLFLTVEAIIAMLAVGVIQEGKMLRYLVRTPVMVLTALFVYEIGKRFGSLIIGGGYAC